ncbi:MAG: hypothetical protein ACXVFN_10850 [Solirubrobacteraceae bacterium]
MGWVVKSWNAAALEELVGAEARETARGIVRDAERDARRIGRAAARETADAAAYLEALETFGVLTRRLVRERRAELRGAAGAEPPPREVVPEPRRITARRGRARLRESPLRDLFRVTTAG